MSLENFVQIQYCYDYLINQIPVSLLFYSHLPTALSSLLVSVLIFFKVRSTASTMLLLTCLTFAAWCISDLGSWFAFLGPGSTMFLWSLLDLLGLLMFFFTYAFLYALLCDKKLPGWQILLIICSALPVGIYTIMGIHLPIYDANSCAAIENETITLYPYVIEFFVIISAFILTVAKYRKTSDKFERMKITSAGFGVLIFLIFFFTATLTVSLLAESDVSLYIYNYEIYGLFGMPILLVYLAYLIVKFKAFNIKLIGAQALVFGLVALIGAQLFFVQTLINTVLTLISLVFSTLGGYFLVRSVRKEVTQREQIQELAGNLEKTNIKLQALDKQKSEFVSIASHQLRSPLTAIRGYSAMFLEGSYGELGPKMKEPLERMFESAKLMAMSIEDFLNVSRIESGNMKYEYSDFSLVDQASHIVDDLRAEAMKIGLILSYKSDISSQGVVHADIGKTQQILHNLINNSLKYTPKGSITVFMHEHIQNGKLFVEIIDTGIGMSQETIVDLFAKFTRAKNANSVNIKGTGLGLFVAREMARAMGGDITAHSAGEGQGSHFILTLPLVK